MSIGGPLTRQMTTNNTYLREHELDVFQVLFLLRKIYVRHLTMSSEAESTRIRILERGTVPKSLSLVME